MICLALRRSVSKTIVVGARGLAVGSGRVVVVVVRHGETDWNKTLRVQGSTDVPLNDKGVAQAEVSAGALSQWLRRQSHCSPPAMVHSSPLSRARETATAIADALGGIPVSTADALREWNLGALEGLTRERALRDFQEDWRIFSQWANPQVPRHDAETPLSQGESMEQVRCRVVQTINDLAGKQEQDNGPIICVTHGGVLGQLLRHVVEQNGSDPVEYPRPGNACISTFSLDLMTSSDGHPQWSIVNWADTSHLVGDLAPISANFDQRTKQ